MATTWTHAGSGSWTTAADWSGGVPTSSIDAVLTTPGAGFTITYSSGNGGAAASITATDDLLAVTNGTLTVSGTASLAAGLQISGGGFVVKGGMTVGGVLAQTGGTLSLSGAVNSAASLSQVSGLIALGTGATLTTAAATLAQTGYGTIDGPGTLSTAGATTVGNSNYGYVEYLGGKLVWNNTGTVTLNTSIYVGLSGTSDTASFVNAAGASFNLTDSTGIYNNTATSSFTNNGTLNSTATGTDTNVIYSTLTNNGVIDVVSGTLALEGGGTLGGTILGAGVLDLANGSFGLAPSSSSVGALELNGATLVLSSGVTSTVADPLLLQYGTISGAGTLATTGTTSVTAISFGKGGTWTNAGTVNLAAGAYIYAGVPTTSGGSVAFVNQAGASFNLGDSTQIYNYTATSTFANSGTLTSAATGTDTNYIYSTLTSTGVINIASGTLALYGGGTLGGTILGAGVLDLTSGSYSLTPSSNSVGTLELSGGATLALAAGVTTTIANPLVLAGDTISGTGTLATTGTTTVTTSQAAFFGKGSAWTNTGTVNFGQSAYIYAGSSAASGGSVAFINQANGTFNLGDSTEIYNYNATTSTFANSGTLTSAASGTDFNYIYSTLASTGLIDVVSGTLALEGGGTLGGTILGAGVLDMDGGSFSLAAASDSVGALALTGGATLALAPGGTTTIADPLTLQSGTISGTGTLATTGTTTVATYQAAFFGTGSTWTNAGTVNFGQSASIYAGSSAASGGSVAFINQAGASFNLGDSTAIYNYNTTTSSFANSGTLTSAATGTDVDYLYSTLTSTGMIDVASGTLALEGGGTLGGSLLGAGVLDLDGGSYSLSTSSNSVGTLELTGGTVALAAGVTTTIGNSLILGGGTFSGTGTLATTGTTTVATYQAAFFGTGSTWTNAGTVNFGQYAYIYAGSGAASGGSVAFINQAGASFNLSDDNQIDNYNSTTGSFANNGTLTSAAAGTDVNTIYSTLTNTAVIDIVSGTLALEGGGTLGGTILGAGVLNLDGGTFTLTPASSSIGTLEIGSGTLALGSGTTTIAEPLILQNGTITGAGTLATTGTTSLTSSVSFGPGITWVNAGTVNFSASAYIYAGVSTASGGSIAFINQAGASFNLGDSSEIYNYNTTTSTFANSGTLTSASAAADTSNIYSALTNSGLLDVVSGTLALYGGGTLGGTIEGAGTLDLDAGSFTISAPSMSIGSLGIGGTASIGPFSYAGITVVNGSLNVTGTASFTGAFTGSGSASFDLGSGSTLALANGGTLSSFFVGSGTVSTAGSFVFNDEPYFGAGVTLTNSGTINDTSNVIYAADEFGASGSAAFVNKAGGVILFSADGTGITNSGITSTLNNAGLIEKSVGTGVSRIDSTVTNTGTIAANTGTLVLDGGGTLGGTIGGIGHGLVQLAANFSAGGASIADDGTAVTLQVANGDTLTNTGTILDAGKLQLGSSSSGSGTVLVNTASGVFDLTGADSTIVNLGGAKISNAGVIAMLGSGKDAIIGAAITNTGLMDAHAGTLTVSGAVTGTGTLQIDAGATLEIGHALVTTQAIAFTAGGGATLKLDTAASVAQTLSGFGGGDRIDLAGTSLSTAVISGNTLTLGTGSTSYTYVSSASLAGLYVQLGADGSGGTEATLYRRATASVAPNPVGFGNIHVGGSEAVSLSVANTAIADGFSENLDGTIAGGGGAFGVGGSFSGLAAGSATTALSVSFGPAAAGAYSGSAVVSLNSDGSGIDNEGTTALAAQTIALTGAVYAYAAPVFSTTTLDLGATRTGDAALTGSLILADGSSASAYQEGLIYGVSGGPSALSVGNGAGTIASGGSVAIGVSLSTGTSGDYTGAQLATALTSTGAGTSGLGNTALPGQTIVVNAQVYATAIAELATTMLNFGVVHVGDSVSENILLTNAATGALVDLLTGGSATLSGYAGSVSFAALGSGLGSGASAELLFSVLTGSAGAVSGSAALSFLSHDNVLADLAINGGTVSVTGTVDNYATAEVEQVGGSGTLSQTGNSYTIDLGSFVQGAAGATIDLGVLNSAAGLADLLGGSFSISGSSAFTNSGFGAFSGLGAGQAETAQVIALSTTAAGTFSETIVLNAAGSNGSGYDGALAAETITVVGTITPGNQTFSLTKGVDTVNGGPGDNTIKAATLTLSSGDQIDGGSSGQNVLALTGSGTFDLRAPTTLTDVQTLTVAEGSGAKGSTVYLRNGLNLAVQVAPGGSGIITFHGASDSDSYTLGAGSDTVILGSASETVQATDGGTALVQATAATAAAQVVGGSTGSTTLQIGGGGSAALNSADSHLTVTLLSATNLMLGSGSFITAVGSGKADTITAGGANQTLTGGAGADTLVGGTGFATTFLDTSAGLNGDTIVHFGGASVVDLTDMDFATLGKITVKQSGSGSSLVSTLKITDGTHTASIKFDGSYTASSFMAAAFGSTGTQLTYTGH